MLGKFALPLNPIAPLLHKCSNLIAERDARRAVHSTWRCSCIWCTRGYYLLMRQQYSQHFVFTGIRMICYGTGWRWRIIVRLLKLREAFLEVDALIKIARC